MSRYDGEAVLSAEIAREKAWQERIDGYAARLVEGPVLVLPLAEMSIQFNPSNLVPLGDAGTVYPTLRISDLWGILEVRDGALLAGDWSEVRVTAPDPAAVRGLAPGGEKGSSLSGQGWSLRLSAGWRLEPGSREGDWLLVGEAGGDDAVSPKS
jgi:hypothetical protein